MEATDPKPRKPRHGGASSLSRESHGGWPIFLIGREDQFVPGTAMFRLKGERPEVWRQLARPADRIAYGFFEEQIGHHLEQVIGRPGWIFHDPPRCDPQAFEPEVRFVDGLLCGCRYFDRWRRLPLDLSGPQTFRQMACTEDAFFECVYHRPAGEQFAHLVSQEECEGGVYRPHRLNFRKNCAWWHLYLDDEDAYDPD